MTNTNTPVDITLYVNCNECGTERSITVEANKLALYDAGDTNCQDVWPELSSNDRETIMGARKGFHLCPRCWKKLFTDHN